MKTNVRFVRLFADRFSIVMESEDATTICYFAIRNEDEMKHIISQLEDAAEEVTEKLEELQTK